MLIPIDSKSYLEVADKHHRYAKNLRLYFKEFCRLHPEISQQISRSPISCGYKSTDESMSSSSKWDRYDPFFQWLDNTVSCDHGMPTDIAPPPQPDMKECPRHILDHDRVLYFTSDDEREKYLLEIDRESGAVLQVSNGSPVTTGSKGWIFVLKDGKLYGCEKKTKESPRLHHSSFFSGKGVPRNH